MQTKHLAVAILAIPFLFGSIATAQMHRSDGKVLIPDSSIEKPTDIGRAAHTNVRVFLPATPPQREQTAGPPYSGYAFETPASLACIYGLTKAVSTCNPNSVTAVPSGGSA